MNRTNPFARMLLWCSPDHDPEAEPERPFFADDHATLLAGCRDALALRQEAYPARVQRGQMTADEAEHDVAGWRLLVAEWEWIVAGGPDGQGRPDPATFDARHEAVRVARERCDHELSVGNRSYDVMRKHQLVAALEYHLTRNEHGEQPLHRCLRLTRQCREDAAARSTAPMTSGNRKDAA